MCGARVCASVCGLRALYSSARRTAAHMIVCYPRKRLPTLTMPTTALPANAWAGALWPYYLCAASTCMVRTRMGRIWSSVRTIYGTRPHSYGPCAQHHMAGVSIGPVARSSRSVVSA